MEFLDAVGPGEGERFGVFYGVSAPLGLVYRFFDILLAAHFLLFFESDLFSLQFGLALPLKGVAPFAHLASA